MVVAFVATIMAQEVGEEAAEVEAEAGVGAGEAQCIMMSLISPFNNGQVVCSIRHLYGKLKLTSFR